MRRGRAPIELSGVHALADARNQVLTHWEIRRMTQDTIARIEQINAERRQAGVADPAH
jgi:hypothetical protein